MAQAMAKHVEQGHGVEMRVVGKEALTDFMEAIVATKKYLPKHVSCAIVPKKAKFAAGTFRESPKELHGWQMSVLPAGRRSEES